MASWLQQQIGKVAGGSGRIINAIGQATGNRLPELNVSENLQRIGGMLNPVKTAYASDTPWQNPNSGINYGGLPKSTTPGLSGNPAISSVLGSSTSGGGVSSQAPYQQITDQGNQGLDLIEQDYNNAMGVLAGQEASLQSQAGAATGQIEGEASATRNELTKQQGTAEQGIQSQLSTAETGGQSAMQQARDLFRQTQQGNIAQLSALGISSSSVAEALAERLGVETARRIAGVTGSLQEVRQNASKELARTKDYYAGKITDIQNWVGTQKSSIQQALLQGLNQINAARNQAASDKARGRAELLSNVQNALYSLTAQQQQFEQSLQQWAAQKSAALTPIVTDPNFLNQLTNATNTFNQNFAPTGFGYAPQVSTDPYGNVKGNITYALKQKQDELANPFATQ